VARVEPATVDVQVQGPVSIINKLRPEDLEVRVDGAALSMGRRSVTPEVHGPPEVTVLTIKPTAVLVVVTRKGSWGWAGCLGRTVSAASRTSICLPNSSSGL